MSQLESNSYQKEDVNKDENINQLDDVLLKPSLGCQKGNACWNKVIGKTVSGDNPIYTSDLDLNSDNIIDQQDLELIDAKISAK